MLEGYSEARRMALWRGRVVALLRVLCGGACTLDACYRWFVLLRGDALMGGRVETLFVPGWPAPWLALAHAYPLAVLIASLELLLACALLYGALTNLACALGIGLILLGCTTTGALAPLLASDLFDPGLLVIALLTFLGLGLGNAGATYGVDRELAQRLGRWSFLASSASDPLEAEMGAESATQPAGSRETDPLTPVPALARLVTGLRSARVGAEAAPHTARTPRSSASKERQRVLFM